MRKFTRTVAILVCVTMLMTAVGCGKDAVEEETIPSAEATVNDPFSYIWSEDTVINFPEISAEEFENDYDQDVHETTEPVVDGPSSDYNDDNELPEISADEWDDEEEDDRPVVTEPAEPNPTDPPATEESNDLPESSGGDDSWDEEPSEETVTEPEIPDSTESQDDLDDELPDTSGDEEW